MTKQGPSSVSPRPASAKASAGRPPVVAVLGHVDHGKTTLLDTIRKTSVAAKEHGGITQHIGAYQILIQNSKVKIQNEKQKKSTLDTGNQTIKGDQDNGRLITFIDTPGHEAFAKMRSRGATVADIAILVVAADDSVKPQTIESIEQIKAAGIPMIVAINKIDLPAANVDRVKGDLAKVGVQVEGFGGDMPVALVSASVGTGVADLLELILLVADMGELKGDTKASVEAIVIETRLDKGKGIVGVVIVKNGTLEKGSPLFEGTTPLGKVRALFDEHGTIVDKAGPGIPVEVLGFITVPQVGSTLTAVPVVANTVVVTSSVPIPSEELKPTNVQYEYVALPDFLKPVADQEQSKFTILLKADTAGSLEAITQSLGDRVKVVTNAVGDIGEADILQAKSSKAIIIGFNVNISPATLKLAHTEKVVVRTYSIIYKLLEEIAEVVTGLKDVLHEERELGQGRVVAEFPYEKERIAGTKVASGRLARGDTIKIMRDETEVTRAKIKSVRQGKNDVTKVETGGECGILFDRKVDFTIGDGIIAVIIG